MTLAKETIIAYYDSCESDYRRFWDLDRSNAMHAGYWDHTTHTLSDALERENEILAEMAGIGPNDRVLDAGCGVGGSSLFLARKYGCEVVGVTLSAKQAATATQLCAKYPLVQQPQFYEMDFTCTSFEDASFDVVWGVESVCHAQDKTAFIREAHRLLKPGGRLIIADGFQLKGNLKGREAQMMSSWLRGWGVDTLETPEGFRKALVHSGFREVGYRDITVNVMPSSKRLYWISFPAFIMSKIGEWLGCRSKMQTENILAAYYQYRTLSGNLWQYGIFTAVK